MQSRWLVSVAHIPDMRERHVILYALTRNVRTSRRRSLTASQTLNDDGEPVRSFLFIGFGQEIYNQTEPRSVMTYTVCK